MITTLETPALDSLDAYEAIWDDLAQANSMALVASDESFGNWNSEIQQEYMRGLQRAIVRAQKLLPNLR